MTRQKRRSKSQHHNHMKKTGHVWRRKSWWKRFVFRPLTISIPFEDDE